MTDYSATRPRRPTEARAYNPTWRDRLALMLMGAMGQDEDRLSPEMRRVVTGLTGSSGLGQKDLSLPDLVPGLGQATLGADTAEALYRGDYPSAAVHGLAMGVPWAIGRYGGRMVRNAENAINDAASSVPSTPAASGSPDRARAIRDFWDDMTVPPRHQMHVAPAGKTLGDQARDAIASGRLKPVELDPVSERIWNAVGWIGNQTQSPTGLLGPYGIPTVGAWLGYGGRKMLEGGPEEKPPEKLQGRVNGQPAPPLPNHRNNLARLIVRSGVE